MKRALMAASVALGVLVLPSVAAMAETLPVPPIPPEHPLLAEIAPVPDVDAREPIATASGEARFDVRLYRARPYDPGLGFAPGSRYQTTEDRKPIQTPGLSISVPLKY